MIAITSPPPLRLFDGDQSLPDNATHWTIRQAFESVTLKKLKRQNRSPGTIAKWEKAVWYWEQVNPHDPPLGAISEDNLNEFPERILEPSRQFGIRTNTAANQQQMYVAAILRSCKSKLSTEVPDCEPLPTEAPSRHRRIIKDEQLAATYFACRSATWSTNANLPAPLVWQSLLVLLCSIGCRRTEAATMPANAFVRSVEFPDLPGVEIDAESPFGWLVFHTPKTRAKKHGLPLVVPVSRCLADHLNELDRLAPARRRMFPIGDHASTWRKEFLRIQSAAGIDDPFQFQDLRKTANRRFRRAGGRDVAAYMLGHQPRGVNATFYDDLADDAAAMLNRCTWPRGFDSLSQPKGA